MDYLKDESELKLDNKKWQIYTNNFNYPPQLINRKATVTNSLVNDACFLRGGTVERSILFRNVDVGTGSFINQSILHSDVKVGKNCILEKVIVMEGTVIPDGTVIRPGIDNEPIVINQENLNQNFANIGGEN